jgi:hypothetical protein
MREYNANHTTKDFSGCYQKFPKEERACGTGSEGALGSGLIAFCGSPSPVTRRFKCERMPSITISQITPSAIIQQIKAIRRTARIYLKVKGL